MIAPLPSRYPCELPAIISASFLKLAVMVLGQLTWSLASLWDHHRGVCATVFHRFFFLRLPLCGRLSILLVSILSDTQIQIVHDIIPTYIPFCSKRALESKLPLSFTAEAEEDQTIRLSHACHRRDQDRGHTWG